MTVETQEPVDTAPAGDVIADQLAGKASTLKDTARETVASLKAAAGSAKETASAAAAQARETGGALVDQASSIAGQAAESARTAAEAVKEKTGTMLHGLSKLIADTAVTVDDRVGPQYGDYARKAADAVSDTARALDEKNVDDLAADAREFVRKKPAVAIGAAAVAGFVLMRLFSGGSKKES
jgi:ElaB/YqjD/DUF883 family membrane-anchored ribosome-binding protein